MFKVFGCKLFCQSVNVDGMIGISAAHCQIANWLLIIAVALRNNNEYSCSTKYVVEGCIEGRAQARGRSVIRYGSGTLREFLGENTLITILEGKERRLDVMLLLSYSSSTRLLHQFCCFSPPNVVPGMFFAVMLTVLIFAQLCLVCSYKTPIMLLVPKKSPITPLCALKNIPNFMPKLMRA